MVTAITAAILDAQKLDSITNETLNSNIDEVEDKYCPSTGMMSEMSETLVRPPLSEQKLDSNLLSEEEATAALHRCYICGKSFSSGSYVHKHVRAIHKTTAAVTPSNTRCPLCKEDLAIQQDLLCHLTSVHSLEIEVEYHAFVSNNEFQNWKTGEEKATLSKFVQHRGKCVYNGAETSKYFCHRSGNYVSRREARRETRRRSGKMMGSNKVGHSCPARIYCVQYLEGCIEVEYVKTHIGHEAEIARIPLTLSERQSIADKMKQRIDVDALLDDIRASVSKESLDRLQLVKRKDINNIAREFNIKPEGVQQATAAMSIHEWVKEMAENNNENPVRLYKRQGEQLPDYPELDAGDFLLVVMTAEQKETLAKYSHDTIVMDGIGSQETSGYNFEQVTVFAIDNEKDGFPCIFIFSNRQGVLPLTVALQTIKGVLGQLTPQALVMKDVPAFFDAWQAAFGFQGRRFICSWHLRQDWKKKLSLINCNAARKKTISDTLFSILMQMDKEAFHMMLNDLLQQLQEDPNTKEFGDYLYTHYAKRCDMWASCYRSFTDFNSASMENLHRIIKYHYLGGKTVKRLDKTLAALTTYVRDKQIARISFLVNGKISAQLEELRKRHANSLNLSPDQVIPVQHDTWAVVSTTKLGVLYSVQYMADCEKCSLYCTECEACAHNFTCTCMDQSAGGHMCKHVHLVCRVRNASTANELSAVNGEFPVGGVIIVHDEHYVDQQHEVEVHLHTLTDVLSPSAETVSGIIQEAKLLVDKHFTAQSLADAKLRLLNLKQHFDQYATS